MWLAGLIVGFALGLLLVVDSRAEYRRWKRATEQNRKQIFSRALSDTNVCDQLAEKLEIQADGGDSPGIL